jgi:hypothetical protein
LGRSGGLVTRRGGRQDQDHQEGRGLRTHWGPAVTLLQAQP